MNFPENEFWQWTLSTYGREGVSPACLRLQDRHGIAVNMVLYSVWTASLGVQLTDEELQAASQQIDPWQVTVVSQLRSIRTRLKVDSLGAPPELVAEFRELVKKLELYGEEMEHATLIGLPRSAGDPSADVSERREMAKNTVQRYLQTSGVPVDGEDEAAVDAIVNAGIGHSDN